MPAFYSASISQFLTDDENLIVGLQTTVTQQGLTELSVEQLDAWRQQIRILRDALYLHHARNWQLILEYPIPRRGKRIDAVILAGSLVLVLEFKCGARKFERGACVQAEDYCLDLRDFHRGSQHRIIIPILVATHAEQVSQPSKEVLAWVAPIWLANSSSLGRTIRDIVGQYDCNDKTSIDPQLWATAEYTPTPTIVEAARALYEGQNVREISRCHAGAVNLTRTSEMVIKTIQTARQNKEKVICFVTGVPGAGKTLAGLNVVHNRALHEGSAGVFLSGNGPLVQVLSEALARDHCSRTATSIAESRRRVSTFIQNVHRFIDAYFSSLVAPQDRVVIFDEAQRAWNATQSNRKFKRNVSEPEIMFDIMDRHKDWAVIVALIGNGQEINTGEAGLREWGRAIIQRFPHWKVFVSQRLVSSEENRDGDALFETRPNGLEIVEEPALHLDVSLRSYRADAISEFVSSLLAMQVKKAQLALASCAGFPIVLTRNLETDEVLEELD